MEKVSIIVPVYNTEQYLEKCLSSILRQTHKELEIICIDDGSTDSSGSILDKNSLEDSRIRVYHIENGGLIAARKFGLNKCTSEYVMFVDSDDWIDEKAVEIALFYMQKYDVDAVGYRQLLHKGNTARGTGREIKQGLYTNNGTDTIISKMYDLSGQEEVLKKNYTSYLFEKKEIFPYIMSVNNEITCWEDGAGMWPFLMNAKKIFCVEEPLYHICYREDSLSHRADVGSIVSLVKGYEHVKSYINGLDDKSDRDYLDKCLKHQIYDSIMRGNMFFKQAQAFYLFPYEVISSKSKIVLYGAGLVGKSYYRQLKRNHYCEIVEWVDGAYERLSDSQYCVHNPVCIKDVDYDYILIAVEAGREELEKIAHIICEKYGGKKDKIICYEPKALVDFVDFE